MTTLKTLTDWSKIPTHHINVDKLTDPRHIQRFFKQNEIDKYLYEIKYKGIVLKRGMSADNSGDWGERLYRQIGHSRIWDVNTRLSGSSGSDWRITEEDFKALYGIEVEKEQLTIRVWDVSNYPFETIDPWTEINKMEAELIQQYVDVVGEKPLGNINDESAVKYRARPNKKVAEDLFDGLAVPTVSKRVLKKKDDKKKNNKKK